MEDKNSTGMIMDMVANKSLNDKKEALDTAVSNNKIVMPTFKRVKQLKANKAPGRNDLCPCGSGKKFKKCCMGTGKYDTEYIEVD